MEIFEKLKIRYLKVVIITIIILLGAITLTVDAAETTTVSIDPSSQTVSSGESFTVNVSCAPGQPIKSFEFRLSFNASLLQVNSVTEGDIFDGYDTFFNAGTINNTTGTVVDIYGLIMGSGNVTGSGTFVTISCTAKDVSGTSTLALSSVGVTNETAYVSITVNNGTVQVDATAPEFNDNSPATGTTGDSYTFNVSVTDNVDTADELTVKVDWSHGGQGGNESMTHVGGNYFEKTVTLDQNSISDMTYTIYARDTYGNSNTTTLASVTVQDNDDPSLVADNSDASGTTGDSFSFDVTASDNIGVGGVNVSWSHGSLSGNLALSLSGGHWVGSVTLDDNLGNLVYTVQVNDTSGNYVRGGQQSKSVTDNDNPSLVADNSDAGGTTGDSFNFYITTSDNIDVDSVNISWSHGYLSGNLALDDDGDGTWSGSIALDDNLGNLVYTVQVNDTSSNYVRGSQQSKSVTDNDNPSLVADNSDAGGTTGDTFGFDVTVSDNIGVDSVNASWSHGSLGGNLALSDDGDGTWSGSITLDDSLNNLVYKVQVNDTSSNYVRGSQQSKTVTDNDNPQISDVSATPSTQDVGGYVNITAVITDNIAIGEIFLNITYPDSSIQNFSITANKTGNTYYCNKTYTTLGTYTYFIWVDDTSDNSVISTTNTFVIGEQTSPQISNITNTTSSPLDTNSSFGWINTTCDVTDNIAVDEVSLNITNPDGSYNNVSMNAGAGDSYYYNSSTAFSTYGNYSYLIWANDTSDNQDTSSSYTFSMPPDWDINNDGDCTVYDLVLVSNHYNETGTPGWIREDVDNNGQIRVIDLVLISEHYDETWWI